MLRIQHKLVQWLVQWIERRWYSQSYSIWHLLTWPLEQLFYSVSKIHKMQTLAKAEGPHIPVIIVGNIHVGGMGKSPVVQALAFSIAKRNYAVGVLLRGYKGQASESDWPLQVTPMTSTALVGDEAVMHASVFEQYGIDLDIDIIVVVDPHRVRGAAFLKKLGVNIIVCDDGLQHYRLLRDCEIVVINGQKGVGRGHVLPTGPLREPLSRLSEVDLVLSSSHLPVNIMQDVVLENKVWLYQLYTDIPVPLCLSGRQSLVRSEYVTVIAGIGQPSGFFQSVQSQGFVVREQCVFPDHYDYSMEDIYDFALVNRPVIMTEKDAVKIRYVLRQAGVLNQYSEVDEDKAQHYAVLPFCQQAFVLPYAAVLEDAFVDRVLHVAITGYEQRRQNV